MRHEDPRPGGAPSPPGDKAAPGVPASMGPDSQAEGRPFQLMGSGKLPRTGHLALGPGVFLKDRGHPGTARLVLTRQVC